MAPLVLLNNGYGTSLEKNVCGKTVVLPKDYTDPGIPFLGEALLAEKGEKETVRGKVSSLSVPRVESNKGEGAPPKEKKGCVPIT